MALNPIVYLPVKCLVGQDMHPGENELKIFYNNWVTQRRKAPFTGEFDLPRTNDTRRLMTVNPAQVSHCITDIRMDTYDKQKGTVMVGVRFTGPKGDEASDACMANKIRFVARSVKVNGEDRIVTWDLVHAPKGVRGRKSLIK